MKVKEIYDYINSFAPYSSQFGWDNSGLTAGSMNAGVTGAVVCLDATVAAAQFAEKNGCNTIISHHPSIFRPVKAVGADSAVYAAIRRGLNTISAHTNWDMADGGVNDVLARILGLSGIEKLYEEDKPMLRTGNAPERSPAEFAAFVSEKLSAAVKYTAGRTPIRKVAVGGGSCGDLADAAFLAGCDAFVTGEAKHSEMIRANELGITLVVAGHYETENPSMYVMLDLLQERFPDEKFLFFDENPAEVSTLNAQNSKL